MTICLDAGHGYKHAFPSGARGNNLIEDDVALDMVTRIGHHLRAAGHATVITRPTAAFIPLKDRPKKARASKSDLFLSIHCNAAGSKLARGAEALIVKPAKGRTPTDLQTESAAIAAVLVHILAGMGMDLRGVKGDGDGQHKSIYVLRNTYAVMPAVLLELGFLTNAGDAQRLADKEWRERAAIAIAAAIVG